MKCHIMLVSTRHTNIPNDMLGKWEHKNKMPEIIQIKQVRVNMERHWERKITREAHQLSVSRSVPNTQTERIRAVKLTVRVGVWWVK